MSLLCSVRQIFTTYTRILSSIQLLVNKTFFHQSSAHSNLVVLFIRSVKLQTYSFSVVGPKAWNGLPVDLRHLPNGALDQFHSRLFFFAWPGSGAPLSRYLEGALYKFWVIHCFIDWIQLQVNKSLFISPASIYVTLFIKVGRKVWGKSPGNLMSPRFVTVCDRGWVKFVIHYGQPLISKEYNDTITIY